MTHPVRLLAALALVAATSCDGRSPNVATLAARFGPIANLGTISGHVVRGGGVTLLAGDASLVRIDLEAGTHSVVTLPCPTGDRCWGLAGLNDGTFWTLKGMHTVMQLSGEGQALRELRLEAAQLGIHGAGSRLVLQPGTLPAGDPVLYAGAPGVARDPWSSMRARPFATLATGAAAALNLVSCGVTRTDEVPCWFPDEPVLFLVNESGATRAVTLEGLPRAVPELLINARVPQRPIRDVFVESDGTIWVIGTGTPAGAASEAPGGWLLARYGRRGEPIDRRQLPEPVRIILRAAHGRALVLTGAGMVSEVQP